jgi:LCP family protein required for cell wall assembly
MGSILFLLVIAGIRAYPSIKAKWEKPLGPGLELPTQIDTPTEPVATEIKIENTPATNLQEVSSTRATATRVATATPQPLCGGPPVMYILGIGADHGEANTYLYGLGDAIRVVRVDFVTPKVTALTIPRDLWVDIPEISEQYGITQGKLNQSYLYGNPGMGYYQGPGGGPGLMARTLLLNFGLRVDHYGAVNMVTFKKIVDAVGGIDIFLPTDVDGTPIDDKTEDMGYFYAGQQHMNGDQALRFSRIRKRYNDFTRGDFQNMVICSLKEKLTSPAVLPKIPNIISAFQGQVLTDLSLEQFGQMACLLPKLERENIIFASLPQDIFTPGQRYSPQQSDYTFVLEYDPEVIQDYMNRFMAGEWPDEPEEPTCP